MTKPGALTVGLVLGWIASGLFLIAAIGALVILSGSYFATTGQYLLGVGLPVVISLLLGGLLFGVARGSEIARIMFTVVAGIVILLMLIGLFSGARLGGLVLLVNLLQFALLIGAIVCLFLPGVNRWMAAGRAGGAYAGAGGAPDQWVAPVQTGWPVQDTGADAQGQAAHLRPCPYCAEPIRAEASKCRYCGSAVTPGV